MAGVRKQLMKEFKIPAELIETDEKRKRTLTGTWIVDELKKELKAKGLKIAIVEDCPTWDKFEVLVDFL